jgi:hypothetical protein
LIQKGGFETLSIIEMCRLVDAGRIRPWRKSIRGIDGMEYPAVLA